MEVAAEVKVVAVEVEVVAVEVEVVAVEMVAAAGMEEGALAPIALRMRRTH